MLLTLKDLETGDQRNVERVEYFEVRMGDSVYVERDGESETFDGVEIGAGSDV